MKKKSPLELDIDTLERASVEAFAKKRSPEEAASNSESSRYIDLEYETHFFKRLIKLISSTDR